MKNQKIPETDSIRELARFWDSHDLTDFEAQLEEMTEPLFERKSTLEIHLLPQEAQSLKELARSKGKTYDDLLRQWVLEKIGIH